MNLSIVILLDLVGLVGAGLVVYGAWLAFPPAGLITGGLLLLAGAVLLTRRGG
jgi:hypothetical protein